MDLRQLLPPLWEPGIVCVYQWAEHLKELLGKNEPQSEVSEAEKVTNLESTRNLQYSPQCRPLSRAPKSVKRGQLDREFGIESLDPQHAVEIHHGEALLCKGSTFTAHLALVSSLEQVQWAHRQLLSDKKIAKATHNIFAYRYRDGREVIAEHDDDNETDAGRILANLLEQCGEKGAFIMVSRSFGGVELHSDRYRKIRWAAQRLLDINGLLPGKATRRQKRKP